MGTVIGNSIGVPFGGAAIDWNSYWTSIISAMVENAQPTHVVMTFSQANTSLVASDFAVTDHTVSSLSRDATNKILTLTLGTSIIFYDVLTVTLTKGGNVFTHAITNNVAADGNDLARFTPSDTLTPVTYDSNMRISQIVDSLGGAAVLAQATQTAKPYATRNGAAFGRTIQTGSSRSDTMRTGPLTYAQPESIYLVIKQIPGWASTNHIMDGNTNFAGGLRQNTSSPNLQVYAGAPGSADDSHLPINQWGIVRIILDGANSVFQVDGNAPITGNFGAGNMAGITLGAAGSGTIRFGKFMLADAIFRKGHDSAGYFLSLYNHLKTKHSNKVGFVPSVNYERKGVIMTKTEDYEAGNLGEQNILYTETDSIIVGNPCFQMWYTVVLTAGGSGIGYAESKDCIHWTKYASNPIIPTYFRCSVTRDAGVYYFYFQQGRIYTGNNPVTLNLQRTGAFVVPAGYSGPANTCIVKDGANWYALMDIEDTTAHTYAVGLSTSANGLDWADVTMVLRALPGSTGGPWFFKSSNGRFYLWSHNAWAGKLPTDFVKYSSVDLINWVMENDEEFLRMTADEGVGNENGTTGGQVGDCTLCEVAGKTYFVYCANKDQAAGSFIIKLATVNKTLDQLAQASIVGQIAEP
jgi:hypothetical protein